MTVAERDYYDVLGVPRDADQQAIKDAFRKLALRYHPDRSKEPDAEDHFKEVAAAYAVLSDPRKRAEYDARGMAGVAGFSPEDLFGGIDFADLFSGFGFEREPSGLFERFFGRRPSGPRKGDNTQVELRVSLQRVLTGGEESVEVARPEPCSACSGSRAKPGTQPRTCEACNGTGRHIESHRRGDVAVQQVTPCPSCHATGTIIDQPCDVCRGSGSVEHEEQLRVSVPAGVEEGMVLRIGGQGRPSDDAGGQPGDLFVIVRTLPDPRFERRGADLWRVETISVPDAVLGTALAVPTLEESTTVRLRAGTQPGAILRLGGRGLPRFGGRGRGDLLVYVDVHIPERLSAAERARYDQLRDLGRRRNVA